MSQQQGPPGPNHIHATGTSLTNQRDLKKWQEFDSYLSFRGNNCITAQGYQNILNNHTVISQQIANLDTTTMAAAAAQDAKEIRKKVKVIRSAAELSVEAQPLLAAIQQVQQQLHQTQEQLGAIQANQNQCLCAIM